MFTAIAKIIAANKWVSAGGFGRVVPAAAAVISLPACRSVAGSPREVQGVLEHCVAGSTRSMDSHSLTFMDWKPPSYATIRARALCRDIVVLDSMM